MKALRALDAAQLEAAVGGAPNGQQNATCEGWLTRLWSQSPTRFPASFVQCQIKTNCEARRSGMNPADADEHAQKVCGKPPTAHDSQYK